MLFLDKPFIYIISLFITKRKVTLKFNPGHVKSFIFPIIIPWDRPKSSSLMITLLVASYNTKTIIVCSSVIFSSLFINCVSFQVISKICLCFIWGTRCTNIFLTNSAKKNIIIFWCIIENMRNYVYIYPFSAFSFYIKSFRYNISLNPEPIEFPWTICQDIHSLLLWQHVLLTLLDPRCIFLSYQIFL